jgi:uncharacterized protein YbjQ (UPF0145 family)
VVFVLITTSESIAGRTVHPIGLVVGCVPFGEKYMTGIKNLRGQTHPDLPALFEQGRDRAVQRMIANCPRGTMAVVSMRFHVREFTAAWHELCAYGTAVRLEPM